MNSSIEVQIDENRYVPLLRLERGAAGSVVLTSREPRQERAVLRLFATRSRTERTHLWTTEIDNIPLEPARPRIDLRVSYRRTVLQVEISLNGLPRQTAKVRIPGERRNPVPVIAAVTAFAVVAAGAAVILTQPSAATAQKPVEQSWNIHFLPDDTYLTANARGELAKITDELLGSTITAVTIVGHCAIAGTEEGRTEISDGRASNVYDFLSRNGLELPKSTVVKGVGSANPLTLDPADQDLNRRVQVTVTYRRR